MVVAFINWTERRLQTVVTALLHGLVASGCQGEWDLVGFDAVELGELRAARAYERSWLARAEITGK